MECCICIEDSLCTEIGKLYRDWKKRKLSLHFEIYWLSSSSPHEWNESQCVVLWYVTIEAGLHCIYQNMLWFQTVAWSWNQVWTWAAQVVPLLLGQRPVLILVAWLNLADKLLGWVKEYIMVLPQSICYEISMYIVTASGRYPSRFFHPQCECLCSSSLKTHGSPKTFCLDLCFFGGTYPTYIHTCEI